MKFKFYFALVLLFPMLALATPELKTQLQQAEFQDTVFQQAEMEAVARATQAWADAVNANDPVKVSALYDDPFVLYATFKTKINTFKELIAYFKGLFVKKNFKVEFKEQTVRAYGGTGLNSGLYVFSYEENSQTKKVEARYTFVYVLGADGNWKIVDHHSSVLPE